MAVHELSACLHCYVMSTVGACQVKTRVINNTLAPVWNQTFEMIVDSADGQFLFIEMFDEDQGNKDDELGRYEDLCLCDL